MVVGDWHGNTQWALNVIKQAVDNLTEEKFKIILSLGDFGLWPGGDSYTTALSQALDDRDMIFWFVDGNHEDHDQLHELHAQQPGPVAIDPHGRIWHLPRGWRWNWHDRTWLALGGAVSLDRAVRIGGRSWWPEEEITEQQATDVIARGPADVMVTHDCPSGVVHTFSPPPSFWDLRDRARSDRHQEQLQGVVSAVQPGWLMHGHLHRAYQRVTDFGYGPVEVTGLDCDDGDGPNWAVLDVKLMKWTGAIATGGNYA
jgi:hypothetical protein